MIAVSLPSPGGNFGWSVAGENITRELRKLDKVVEATDGDDYPWGFLSPMLHAIQGANMLPLRLNYWSYSRNVGYCFVEDSLLVGKYAMNATRYFDHIVAGSTWCQDILREAGIIDTSVIIQGIAPEYFEATKTVDDYSDKFVVFSGGKCEYRKGQDIVAKAMKVFMDRHKDVYLRALWNNPWECGDYAKVRASIIASGLDYSRVIGNPYAMVAHKYTKDIYAQCDIGLFPNRCEAGNNMVMCEFMACGKPVIATYATGHKDVLDKDCPINLTKLSELRTQTAVWVEPDLEETIAHLETAYKSRDMVRLVGSFYRERMRQFTWEACAKKFYDILIKM